MTNAEQSPPDLKALMIRFQPAVLTLVREEAGVLLLRFETPEDLVQGVFQEALRSTSSLQWRGDESFKGWLFTIARRHLSNRRDYWFACKRNPGAILRLTLTGADGGRIERRELADTATGPATFAFRREQLVLASKSLAMLLPRDREIVTWASEGAEIGEIAARLGISEESAQRARSRALDRLRKTFTLMQRSGKG